MFTIVIWHKQSFPQGVLQSCWGLEKNTYELKALNSKQQSFLIIRLSSEMGNRPFEMFDSPSVLLLDVVAEGVFAALESPPLSVPALVSCFNSAQESWLEIEKSTRTPFWIKWKAEANIQGVYDCNTAAHSLPKNYWLHCQFLLLITVMAVHSPSHCFHFLHQSHYHT